MVGTSMNLIICKHEKCIHKLEKKEETKTNDKTNSQINISKLEVNKYVVWDIYQFCKREIDKNQANKSKNE